MNSLSTFAIICALTSCILLQADDRRVRTSRPDPRVLPLPKEDGVFHVVIYGDRTGGPKDGINVVKQAVQDTNLLAPDFVVTVGDLIEGYKDTAPWMRDMKEYRDVMRGLAMPWFPVAGNHDIYWNVAKPKPPPGHHESNYEKHFGPLWYWFPHKHSAFIVLYTDEGDRKNNKKGFNRPELITMSPEQLKWLEETLAKTKDKKQVFVFLHHPRWIEGRYKGGNWNVVHDLLAKAGNVKACFAGHIHRMRYDGKKDGIEYFALAVTGGNIGAKIQGGGWSHHMNILTVREESYSVAAVPVGAVFDPRQFTPERLKEIDQLRSLRPTALTKLRIHSGGDGNGSFSYRVRNPASQPIEVTAGVSGNENWLFSPDHIHFRLAPGKDRKVDVGYLRKPVGPGQRVEGIGKVAPPKVSLEIDYVTEGGRISLGSRDVALGWTLGNVDESFFEGGTEGALQLGGKGDCVRVESGKLGLTDGPLTVEARIRPKSLKGDQAIVAKTESSELSLFLQGDKLGFRLHLDGKYAVVASESGSIREGVWQHVAGVFDGKQLRVYVDGKLAGKADASGKRKLNGLPLYVGADPDGKGNPTKFFGGEIDEVRVSTVACYAGEAFEPVRRHASTGEHCRLLLHLDRDLGEWMPDRSPRRANGVRRGKARCLQLKGARP